MMLFVVIVIGVCYLLRFLLADRPDSSVRRPPEMLRTTRVDRTTRSDPKIPAVDGESLRWTALDDHQLRRLLGQSSP